ncbi:substrate-binding domain-containing protein [Oryzibacter oryziterrae]|uniref:substrate-binding domain-containing protein n=1 Tax=Oryzibacter oryziterrae TaxID=2766474 RepID=UPI001F40FC25|nr:substrate-binding domain-containing protein [Oryzibacter oryziterrae]
MKFSTAASSLALGVAALFPAAAFAADQIHVAGSSTVLPYATIVAEAFAEANPSFKAPIVEGGGTGAGLKEFCKGAGEDTIDVANASRPIKAEELDACKAAGVTEVQEVKIGYDGIVFASDIKGPDFAYEPADWFNAIGAKVLKDGQLVDNTNAKWSDVKAGFPDWDIAAYIPGEKHGTREVFEQKLLLAGCKATKAYDAYVASGLAKADAEKACVKIRKDGKAVDIDGEYNETLARIDSNKTGIGVFGLAFYENNKDKLKVATVSGITPSTETIAKGTYPVSRPLFFYVKKAHLGAVPGLKEYVEFFLNDKMIGPRSPAAEKGLVPAPKEERKAALADFKAGKTL